MSDSGPTSLSRDRAFWGMTCTQFLGAFNDNLYKQMLLLLFVSVPTADGSTTDMQVFAAGAFAISFVLCSGLAGYLADRYSKRTVILLSKWAELAVMLVGGVLFWLFAGESVSRPIVITLAVAVFFMGAQSAFFAPSKYGILPELFKPSDLPPANGIILMTTFMGIIFGTALAGVFLEWLGDAEEYVIPKYLWMASGACMLISLVGIVTVGPIRKTPPAHPKAKLNAASLTIPPDITSLLRRDVALRNAVLASVVFWLTAAIVQLSVNSLGRIQLKLSETETSLMVSSLSIGIAIGSLIAGRVSRNQFNTKLIKLGAWGLTVSLLILAPQGPGDRPHLLGYGGSIVALIVLGAFTGLFAVPLQVFVQNRPPGAAKGRLIATQTLLNWIGISLSALLYKFTSNILQENDLPASTVFYVTAFLMLMVAIFYRPKSETL